MELEVITQPGREWDELVAPHSDLIFHRAIWAEVLRRGFGAKIRYFCLRRAGQPVLALPGMVLDFRFWRLFYSLVPYGGFVGEREYIPQMLPLVEAKLRELSVHRMQIVDVQAGALAGDGWHAAESPRHALRLRGRNPEEMWASYSGQVRRDVQRAEKRGVVVRPIAAREEVEVFHKLYLAAMARSGAAAKYPKELAYAVYDLLVPRQAEFIFAVNQGLCIGGLLVLHSGAGWHCWQNGSLDKYLPLRPNDALLHHIIAAAAATGQAYVDLMGSPAHDPSLVRFKEKWGAEKVGLFVGWKDLSPLRGWLWKGAYALANSRWGAWLVRRARR